MEFQVHDMSCGHCVSSVTKAVKTLDPGAKVDVDLESGRVSVASAKDAAAVKAAIENVGYPADAMTAR